MLSETLTHWVPNLWTPYQPLVNLVAGKEAPKEMILNVKSIKQRREKLMDGFISRFTFNEGSPAQKTYCDTIAKQKSYLSMKTSIKMIQLLQERKISLLLKPIMLWQPYPEFAPKHELACHKQNSFNMLRRWNVNEANRKSFFRNKLQSLSPVAPIKSPPTCITTSVVDALRVVRIIAIKDTNPPLFVTWAGKAFAYTEHFSGSSIDILFHNYNWEDDTFLNPSKGRLTSQTERNICSLNQVLPNPSEWLEFLSKNKKKFFNYLIFADFSY